MPAQEKITLYTNHICPYAHRVHTALAELGLEFDEVIIDLSKPREQWYLDINPVNIPPPHHVPMTGACFRSSD